MSNPAWNNVHDPFYDQYSLELEKFLIPDHFDVFMPEDDSLGCKAVLMPSPRKGAINFTRNGKFILIGVYKDMGRPPTAYPTVSGISWTRVYNQLIMTHVNHKVKVNDKIYVYNVNKNSEQYLTCTEITDDTFTLKLMSLGGGTSGSIGQYRLNKIKDFQEENLVFRFFPHFGLLTIAELQDIVTQTSPNYVYQQSTEIKNITTNKIVRTPSLVNSRVNYTSVNNWKRASEVISSAFKLNIRVKGSSVQTYQNGQVFDHKGKPLKLKYDTFGRVISPDYYDSKFKNTVVYLDATMLNENPDNGTGAAADHKVWCYDFYGIEINDPARGPFYANDIITRDVNKEGNMDNIFRKTNNEIPIYSMNQLVYNTFGEVVVGINENNTLNVIRQRIPLQLDNFGRPAVSLPYL
jgi:hypothetical protein